jgi:hypothetical protein
LRNIEKNSRIFLSEHLALFVTPEHGLWGLSEENYPSFALCFQNRSQWIQIVHLHQTKACEAQKRMNGANKIVSFFSPA